jgi:hypothetical protein
MKEAAAPLPCARAERLESFATALPRLVDLGWQPDQQSGVLQTFTKFAEHRLTQ